MCVLVVWYKKTPFWAIIYIVKFCRKSRPDQSNRVSTEFKEPNTMERQAEQAEKCNMGELLIKPGCPREPQTAPQSSWNFIWTCRGTGSPLETRLWNSWSVFQQRAKLSPSWDHVYNYYVFIITRWLHHRDTHGRKHKILKNSKWTH